MRLKLSLRAVLDRIPVGRQLYLAFGALLLLTGALGAISVWGLHRVDSQAGTLAGKWLVGLGHLADMRAAALEMRDFEIKHSRTDDPSYHAEYEDKIKESMAGMAKRMEAYQALVGDDAERDKFAALSKALAGYQAAQAKVVKLGRDKQK
jgi:methyl-accepting chemotaxis protein